MSRINVVALVAACAIVIGCGPDAPNRTWQDHAAGRAEALADSIGSRSSRVVWLGDSLAEGWARTGASSWAKSFGMYGAMNLGISGERTWSLANRVANWPRPDPPPELLILHVGTNDTNDGPIGAEELAARVLNTAALVDSLWSPEQVLVSALLPRDAEPGPRRRTLVAANDILRAQSASRGYLFLDVGHLFVSDDGSIPQSLMPDALHLSESAYRIWAAEFEPVLRDALGPSDGASR